VRHAGNGHVQADLQHQFLERQAVFALVDGLGLGADHFDVVPFQRAVFVQGHRGVQRGLAAERGQQHQFALRAEALPVLGLLAHDDFLHAFRRDGFDVGAVGELRVGHDGGRVGVDEHDAVAFLLEGLAGLGAGIIKFARLADDDRAGADDEDGMNVGALARNNSNKANTRRLPPLRRPRPRRKLAAPRLIFRAANLKAAACCWKNPRPRKCSPASLTNTPTRSAT
jgi:hypothetical protein